MRDLRTPHAIGALAFVGLVVGLVLIVLPRRSPDAHPQQAIEFAPRLPAEQEPPARIESEAPQTSTPAPATPARVTARAAPSAPPPKPAERGLTLEEHAAAADDCDLVVLPPRSTNAAGFDPQWSGTTLRGLTPHYELFVDGSCVEVDELERVLEAAWIEMGRAFEISPGAPRRRLPVHHFANRERWEAAAALLGYRPGRDVVGFYHRKSRSVMSYRTSSIYLTRRILLHEAVHQFQHYIDGDAAEPTLWHSEGLAEYLSHHYWDGTRLTLGVPQRIQNQRSVHHGSELFADPRFSMCELLDGVPQSNPELAQELTRKGWDLVLPAYGIAEAIFSHFRGWNGHYSSGFAQVLDASRSGGDVVPTFTEAIGPPDLLRMEILATAGANRMSLRSESGDWEFIAPGRLEGTARTGLAALTRTTAPIAWAYDQVIGVEVDPSTGRGGIDVRAKDARVRLLMDPDSVELSLGDDEPGGAIIHSIAPPAASQTVAVVVRYASGELIFAVNGNEVYRLSAPVAPLRLSLIVESGTVRFRYAVE